MLIDTYEIVDHTADWALHLIGGDLSRLLIIAAQGMSSLLVNDIATIPKDEIRQFEINAYDRESLLVEWLTELAYWAEIEQLVFCHFELSNVTNTHLDAVAYGSRVIELQKHIKAVTYHNLEITKTDDGLEATIVFDV